MLLKLAGGKNCSRLFLAVKLQRVTKSKKHGQFSLTMEFYILAPATANISGFVLLPL